MCLAVQGSSSSGKTPNNANSGASEGSGNEPQSAAKSDDASAAAASTMVHAADGDNQPPAKETAASRTVPASKPVEGRKRLRRAA